MIEIPAEVTVPIQANTEAIVEIPVVTERLIVVHVESPCKCSVPESPVSIRDEGVIKVTIEPRNNSTTKVLTYECKDLAGDILKEGKITLNINLG